jgi:hypothetical protein
METERSRPRKSELYSERASAKSPVLTSLNLEEGGTVDWARLYMEKSNKREKNHDCSIGMEEINFCLSI